MARNQKPSNEFMNRIFKRIRKNFEGSGDVIYKHVLRIHNQQAYCFANQAMKKMKGLFAKTRRSTTTMFLNNQQKPQV